MDDATCVLELPDDPVLLKRLIVQIKREAADQIEALAQRHKAEMDAVLRRFYGPHAERFDPTQLLLFGITIDRLPVDHKTVEAESGQKLKTQGITGGINHHKHGRGKLPMAQAMQYTLNQWDALNRYVEQGFLNIDNNAAERALKRVAIGRKNWLFAGNDDAAANHARLYTLIASAQRHGVDPQAYLTSVLSKISSTPLSELNQFLPDVWKADSQRESTISAPIAVSQNTPAQ